MTSTQAVERQSPLPTNVRLGMVVQDVQPQKEKADSRRWPALEYHMDMIKTRCFLKIQAISVLLD